MENTFEKLGLSKEILKSVEYLGYNEPTEVQSSVIPMILEGYDIIVQSQTGSGKTASFGIPICEKVSWENRKPQALILAPTRELVIQIEEDIFNIGRFKRLKVESIYGRSSFEKQSQRLKEMTHVIVATPGRLLDHISQGTIDLKEIEYVVIDEADEMFNMGFIEQIEKVLRNVPQSAQKMLFSATMPDSVLSLTERYLKSPLTLEIDTDDKVEDRIDQRYYIVNQEEKPQLLESVLIVENPDTCIIFCNTKEQVESVYDLLESLSCPVETLHGGMEQRFRTKVISDFKHGLFRYLVATDVAARGLDIENVSLVINYDIPENVESYTHRVGRTARVDKYGKALSFTSNYEMKYLDNIMAETNHEIEKVKAPSEGIIEDRRPQFEAKMSRRPKIKKDKSHEFKKEITKIHINAGKKTKMRPVDVVGAICSIDGMSAEDIGVIDIVDVSTFVEILNNKGDLVLKALKKTPIKGRIRKASKANKTTYERLL